MMKARILRRPAHRLRVLRAEAAAREDRRIVAAAALAMSLYAVTPIAVAAQTTIEPHVIAATSASAAATDVPVTTSPTSLIAIKTLYISQTPSGGGGYNENLLVTLMAPKNMIIAATKFDAKLALAAVSGVPLVFAHPMIYSLTGQPMSHLVLKAATPVTCILQFSSAVRATRESVVGVQLGYERP